MGVFLPDIKVYYKVTIITLDGHSVEIIKTGQWNKRKSPEKVQKYSEMY